MAKKKENVEFNFKVVNTRFGQEDFVDYYNIFDNVHVYESTLNLCHDFIDRKKMTKEEFTQELDHIIKWQEWGRCEYEVLVGEWPFHIKKEDVEQLLEIAKTDIVMDSFRDKIINSLPLRKIDCYEQAHANIDIIADYVIKTYKEA